MTDPTTKATFKVNDVHDHASFERHAAEFNTMRSRCSSFHNVWRQHGPWQECTGLCCQQAPSDSISLFNSFLYLLALARFPRPVPALEMPRSGRTHVYLSVYELLSFGKYNPYLMPVGLGAYHTGVEIYGEEISYGYHDSHTSGIFSIEPQSAPECRYVYVRRCPSPRIAFNFSCVNWQA